MDKDGESGGRGGGSDSCQQYWRSVILTLTRSPPVPKFRRKMGKVRWVGKREWGYKSAGARKRGVVS